MPKAKKTTAKKKPAKQTKAAFVRSLPANMPAKEVVVKAKAAGISLNEDTVYKTRSMAKARGKKPSGTGRKSPKKVASPKARGRSPDKTNRVLELVAQNPGWSAGKVATAAKCSVTHVYAVWRKPRKEGGAANGSASPKSPVMQHLEHVRALRGVILHVGIDRAKEMMDQIVKDLLV